jgi:hypothetical protein
MTKKYTVLATLLMLALSAGASQAEVVPPVPKPVAVPPAASAAVTAPAAKPAPVVRADALSGKILEIIDGGGYTFFQLENGGEKFWAATPPTQAKVGDEISLQPGIEMADFKSKSLNRTFERIYFSGGKVLPSGATPDSDYLKNKAHSMRPSSIAAPEVKAAQVAPQLTGKILEKLDGGGYSYFLLEKEGKKTWVATSPMDAKVGDTISFAIGVEMHDFKSKALNRTFETITFTDGGTQGEVKALPKAEPASAPSDVKVAKTDAPNGYTVAELYSKSGDLNGKEVVVQGKVVKVSKQIMGKNWVHLQDGSGDSSLGSNNLVTTSQDIAVVGDIVVATGKLAKDKDFGGGYKYAVIIEETKLVKK